MFCEKCGGQMTAGAPFCPHCGGKSEAPTAPVATQTPVEIIPQTPTAPVATQTPVEIIPQAPQGTPAPVVTTPVGQGEKKSQLPLFIGGGVAMVAILALGIFVGTTFLGGDSSSAVEGEDYSQSGDLGGVTDGGKDGEEKEDGEEGDNVADTSSTSAAPNDFPYALNSISDFANLPQEYQQDIVAPLLIGTFGYGMSNPQKMLNDAKSLDILALVDEFMLLDGTRIFGYDVDFEELGMDINDIDPEIYTEMPALYQEMIAEAEVQVDLLLDDLWAELDSALDYYGYGSGDFSLEVVWLTSVSSGCPYEIHFNDVVVDKNSASTNIFYEGLYEGISTLPSEYNFYASTDWAKEEDYSFKIERVNGTWFMYTTSAYWAQLGIPDSANGNLNPWLLQFGGGAAGVLAPQYLRFVESSREQADMTTANEIWKVMRTSIAVLPEIPLWEGVMWDTATGELVFSDPESDFAKEFQAVLGTSLSPAISEFGLENPVVFWVGEEDGIPYIYVDGACHADWATTLGLHHGFE